MNCHESARGEVERRPVAICGYCSVGLCKDHRDEMHRSPTMPLYTCLHQPEQGLDTLTGEAKGSRSSVPHLAA